MRTDLNLDQYKPAPIWICKCYFNPTRIAQEKYCYKCHTHQEILYVITTGATGATTNE